MIFTMFRCLSRCVRQGIVALSVAVVVFAASSEARGQPDQRDFNLYEVRVARFFNMGAPEPTDVRRFKPTDIYQQDPRVIEVDASRRWYDHKVTLEIKAPSSVRDGQDATFTATSTAAVTYRLEQPTTWGGFDVGVAYRYVEAAFEKKLGTQQNPLGSGNYSISATKTVTVPVTGGDGVIRGSLDNTGQYRSIYIYTRSSNMSDQAIIEVHYVYKLGHPAPAPAQPPTPTPPQPAPCPPNVAGKWLGPISGLYDFQVNGDRATGTIANLDGKFGPVTVTGTVNGKNMTGTWRGASASGSMTIIGPDAACVLQMTYTVDNPPGPGGRENIPRVTTGAGSSNVPGGGSDKPWDTAQGRDCFEQWITLATRLINEYDGGPEHNGRKPWSFNRYGLLEGKGITSAFAPDDFAAHGSNRYWWMWDYYVTDAQGRFKTDMFNRAGVPPLRDFVLRCVGAADSSLAGPSTPGATGTPGIPGATGTSAGDGMVLIAPDVIVPRGSRVLIPVRLLNARDVLNMDFELVWQPQVAQAQLEADRGSVVTQIWEYKLNAPNQFRFNFASLTPFNGSGMVGGFRFDAIGPGRSRTPLTLTVHTVNNSAGDRLPITLVHGSITIYDPADLSDPNNPNSPNAAGLAGAESAGGRQPTCSGTGRQTVADAQCALKMWVGLTPRSLHMDVNGDGTVDSRDAVNILQNVARELSR